MSKDAFDNELDNHLEEKDNECLQCRHVIDSDKMFCSSNCLGYYNQ